MAVDTFKPINQTISEIFSCDGIYKIPNYQRQYSWQMTNQMFYGMIYMKHIKIEQKVMTVTFCSIVVVNDGKRYFELIDGQQRITTLMILMNVLEKELHSFSNSLNKVYESNNNEILSLRYIS